MEYFSRFYIGSILLTITYATYTNKYMFAIFVVASYLLSLSELLSLPKKTLKYTKLIMLINYLWIISVMYNLNSYKEITRVIMYNSVSDIIQYIAGKTIGRHKLFSFTSKSLEGYIAGIVGTHMLFRYDLYFVLLNMIGMCGGIFSSIVKRKLKLKHWSNMLGPHGGVNDRLDSLCLPIIIYLNFMK